MRDPDGGRRLVDVLAARAAGTEGIDLQILWIDLDFDVVHFGKHSNGRRGRMHAALRFRFRHALYAMHAALVFQAGICPVAGDHKADLLITAELRLIHVEQLRLPAVALGIHAVHAE